MVPNFLHVSWLGVLLLLSPAVHAQAPPVVPATADEILAAVQESNATITVLNFWATWCVPCREEFPDLVKIGKEFDASGVDVVFVSADFAEDLTEARRFLLEQGVTETSYWKEGDDDAFIRTIHDGWSGALPATILIGPGGEKLDFWEGKTTYEALSARLKEHLK